MSLKPLSTIKAPDLIDFDRDTVSKEIMDRMKTMPGWQDIFTGEQYQDASQFVIQLFSYLFEKNAMSTNRIVRENFISEAFSERAVYANLAQMRVSALQNKESTVELIARIDGAPLTKTLVLPQQLKVVGNSITNKSILFEIIPKDDAGEYMYLDSVTIEPTTFTRLAFRCMAYAGETKTSVNSMEAWSLENMRIQVPYDNIIENSVQIYFRTSNQIMIPLKKTTKFVVEPYIDEQTEVYFPDGVPHYIVRYTAAGRAIIYFGSADFGGAFNSTHTSGSIVVYCRVGGGIDSNVNPGAIDYNTSISVFGEADRSIQFYNPEGASGGEDREDYQTAQIFAPLRYGRDGATVVVDDAQAALYRSVVKHEIDTPQYSELSPTIPLLHAFHYIVPKGRDFRGFVLPEPYVDEEVNAYLARLILALNIFLSVKGTNDSPVLSELVTYFVDADVLGSYNFLYTLETIKPLSGSLSLTAYDYEDDLVDSIKWTNNYALLDTISSDVALVHATLETNAFDAITVTTDNREIVLKFDNQDYTFTLNMPPGPLVSPSEIVDELLNQIQYTILTDSNAAYFWSYRTFAFFSLEPVGDFDKIVITSPTYGKSSKIELLAHSGSPAPDLEQYGMLGLTIGSYRPTSETQLVFPSGSLYHHSTGEIEVVIDSTEIDKAPEYLFKEAWEQPTGAATGPTIMITLEEDNPFKLTKIIPNSDLVINAINADGDIVDYLTWTEVTDTDLLLVPTYGGGIDDGQGGVTKVFDSANIASMSYDYQTGKITMKLVDGVLMPQYILSFPEISKIVIAEVTLDGSSWIDVSPQPWNNNVLTYIELDCPSDDTPHSYAEWHQKRFDITGPATHLHMSTHTTSRFEASKSYEVRVYKYEGNTDVLMSRVRFDMDVNTLPMNVVMENITDTALTTYNSYANGIIYLTFVEGTLDTNAIDYYGPTYTEFTRLQILYKRKSYSYITAAYNPNPYMPTGEAASYVAILKPTSKRMICLEDIIKDITFAPVAGTLTIYIGPGFSEYDVYYAAREAILSAYGYDNINSAHSIGTTVAAPEIQATVMKALAANYGVEEVSFLPSNDYSGLSTDKVHNTYFFVPDDTLVEAVKSMESLNISLAGLSAAFEMTINVIARRRK